MEKMRLSWNARYNIKWAAKVLATITALAITIIAIIGGITLILIGISKFIVTVTGTNTFLEMYIAAIYIIVYTAGGAISIIASVIAIIKLFSQ